MALNCRFFFLGWRSSDVPSQSEGFARRVARTDGAHVGRLHLARRSLQSDQSAARNSRSRDTTRRRPGHRPGTKPTLCLLWFLIWSTPELNLNFPLIFFCQWIALLRFFTLFLKEFPSNYVLSSILQVKSDGTIDVTRTDKIASLDGPHSIVSRTLVVSISFEKKD